MTGLRGRGIHPHHIHAPRPKHRHQSRWRRRHRFRHNHRDLVRTNGEPRAIHPTDPVSVLAAHGHCGIHVADRIRAEDCREHPRSPFFRSFDHVMHRGQVPADPRKCDIRGRCLGNPKICRRGRHRLSRNIPETGHNQPVQTDRPRIVGRILRVQRFIDPQRNPRIAQPGIRKVIDPDRTPTGVGHYRPEHWRVGGTLTPTIREGIGGRPSRIRPVMMTPEVVTPLMDQAQRCQAAGVNHREGVRLKTRRRHRHEVRKPTARRVLVHQRHQVGPDLIPQRMHLVHQPVRLPLQRRQCPTHRSRLDVGHLPQVHQGEPHRNLAVGHRCVRIRHRLQDLRLDARNAVPNPGCGRVDQHHVHHAHPAVALIQHRCRTTLRSTVHHDGLRPHHRALTLPVLNRHIPTLRQRLDLVEFVARRHGPVNHPGNHPAPQRERNTAQRLSHHPSIPDPVSAGQLGHPIPLHPQCLTGKERHLETRFRQHRRIHRHALHPALHRLARHSAGTGLGERPNPLRGFHRHPTCQRQPHRRHDPRLRPAPRIALHHQSSVVCWQLHSGEPSTRTLQPPQLTA